MTSLTFFGCLYWRRQTYLLCCHCVFLFLIHNECKPIPERYNFMYLPIQTYPSKLLAAKVLLFPVSPSTYSAIFSEKYVLYLCKFESRVWSVPEPFLRFLLQRKDVLGTGLVWKFCGKTHFPQSIGRKDLSTKWPHREIRWNYCTLRRAWLLDCIFVEAIWKFVCKIFCLYFKTFSLKKIVNLPTGFPI